jgi:cytochrome c oxidase subunit 3
LNPVTVTVALLAGIVFWVLVVRRLTAHSWDSTKDEAGDVGAIHTAPQRIGLWIFLAVVTSLFSLFLSAFSMRMHHGGGSHVMLPGVLWLNSAFLVIGSVSMQFARHAVDHGLQQRLKLGLAAGGLFTIAFLAGQLVAWGQLRDSGHFIQGSSATAFFYLLTAVHGLHLLGGLGVWGRTMTRLLQGTELVDLRLSVELCTVYWHYLLLVWFVLFGALSYM